MSPLISLLLVTKLTITIFLSPYLLTEACGRSKVILIDNEYKNLVIAINDNVPENLELVERIKLIFNISSQFLFEVTRKRAVFREISILLPKSWSEKPEYVSPDFESYDSSDIVIDYPDESYDLGHKPYTINPTPCGELGQFIHLTPQYILEDKIAEIYGPYEKAIIHEWSHLRYGVYDEYPSESTGESFYGASNGEIEATRCALAISGKFLKDGKDCAIINNLPEEGCIFEDDRDSVDYTGSLMYKQFLPSIKTYCDNEDNSTNGENLHNREAPNKQNQLCDGKSVWEVLRLHGDFEDGVNSPINVNSFPTEPNFKLVKLENKRTVLVLDVSKSMNDDSKLIKLGQAVSNYISGMVKNGEKVGIVTFAETSQIETDLVEINNTTRKELLTHIPKIGNGATSIGAGMVKGLEVLEKNGMNPAGGLFIVVSDGEENKEPFIDTVKESILNKNVVIDTIAIGQEADLKLEALAAASDGQSFFYPVDSTSNALNEAFVSVADKDTSIMERTLLLYSNSIKVFASFSIFESIYIDSTIGKETEFSFDYLGESVIIEVTGPNGEVIDSSSDEYYHDSTFSVIRILLPNVAETGKWSFNITNPSDLETEISISITSKSRSLNQSPIITTAQWSSTEITPPDQVSVYVSVSKGYVPILSASVQAAIERPDGKEIILILLDNGASADITKNDGIYSSYFTEFNGADRYSAKIEVKNSEDTVISPSRIIGVGLNADPTFENSGSQIDQDEIAENFQRVSSGGSFQCIGECSGEIDLYSPARITNLKLTKIDYDNKKISLEFVAPGDDLDFGSAFIYFIRVSTSFDELFDNFTYAKLVNCKDIVVGNIFEPKPAGQVEKYTIQIAEQGDMSYYFAIVAQDDVGNTSPRSNIVSASMKSLTSVNNIPLIVGLTATFGTLILIAVIILLVVKRKHKKILTKKIKKPNEKNVSAVLSLSAGINNPEFIENNEYSTLHKDMEKTLQDIEHNGSIPTNLDPLLTSHHSNMSQKNISLINHQNNSNQWSHEWKMQHEQTSQYTQQIVQTASSQKSANLFPPKKMSLPNKCRSDSSYELYFMGNFGQNMKSSQ